MRPPLVKRHTDPESGFFAFVPPVASWHRPQTVVCADVLAVGRRRPSVAAPHTSCGALAAWATRADHGLCVRCDRAMSRCPPPGRCQDRAQRVDVVQGASGAGAEQPPQAVGDTRRGKPARARRATHSAGRRAWCPRGALACPDARHAAVARASVRGLPVGSREAVGASAPLPAR